MPSAAELRTELRAAMKAHKDYQPVSKMAKSDVSALLQRLKVHTEETPAAGMMRDESKRIKPSSVSAKKAKEEGFPVELHSEKKTKAVAILEPKPEKKVEKKAEKSVEKKAESNKITKGSDAMREKMARIRALKGKKKE